MEHDPNEPVNFRYDVVCIIANPSLSRKDVPKIREHILKDCVGDCLVMGGMKGMIKVHFHTDNPEELFKVLEQYGEFESKAVEDMKKQYEEFKKKKEEQKEQ